MQESLKELMIQRSWYGREDDFTVILQGAPLIAEPPFVSVSFSTACSFLHMLQMDFRNVCSNLQKVQVTGVAPWFYFDRSQREIKKGKKKPAQ